MVCRGVVLCGVLWRVCVYTAFCDVVFCFVSLLAVPFRLVSVIVFRVCVVFVWFVLGVGSLCVVWLWFALVWDIMCCVPSCVIVVVVVCCCVVRLWCVRGFVNSRNCVVVGFCLCVCVFGFV